MKRSLVFFGVAILLVTAEPPKPVYGPPQTGGGGGGGGYTGGGGGGGSYTGGGGGGGSYTGGGDEISEPANYEFSYEVQDAKAGLDFGHMESRQGDSAKGTYHVLLPDGRTQRVNYVADQNGYMPKVIYEGEARPDSFGPPGGSGGGGGSGGSGGSGGGGGGGYRY